MYLWGGAVQGQGGWGVEAMKVRVCGTVEAGWAAVGRGDHLPLQQLQDHSDVSCHARLQPVQRPTHTAQHDAIEKYLMLIIFIHSADVFYANQLHIKK